MYKEKFDFHDTVTLVVGSRGYLGTNFCSAISELGGKVYSADIVSISKAAKGAGNSLEKHDDKNILQFDVDVKDEKSVEKLIDKIISKESRIDNFIFCAATKAHDHFKPFTESSLVGWQTVVRTEMDGMFLCTKHVGRKMEVFKKGNIVLLSSVYGVVGNDQRIYRDANLAQLYGSEEEDEPDRIYSPASYSAVKGAVISLTKFLAAYWGEYGIRVNCVSPGGVSHPGENEDFVKRYSYRTPLGRKAEVDEITSSVLYLVSDLATYVTGHNLIVDGGWTIW